jgi:hypothetical protein
MISDVLTIENRATTISVIEHGILKVLIKPDLELEKSDIDEIASSAEKMCEGKKILLLVNISNNTTGTSEVREYSSREGASKFAIAIAYVIDSLAQKIVINFFINLYRREKPTRMFNSEKDAIAWLAKFKV